MNNRGFSLVFLNFLLEDSKQLHLIRHDINKYLTAIKNLVNNKEYDKFNNYINQLDSKINEPILPFYTNIASIDSVLISKLKECQKQGISFSYSIDTSKISYFNEIDLAILLLNQLNIAITDIDENIKIINLTIQSSEDLITITISSTINNNLLFKDESEIYSTLLILHHDNVESSRCIIDKYNGIITNKIINNFLITTITLKTIEGK